MSEFVRPATPGDAADAHRRGMLLANARAIRAEIEQIFIDCVMWHSLHPHEAPINCDPYGQLRRYADQLDAMLLAEQRRPL